MDYEKKYKEALGWMRSLYDGLHGKTKEEAELYFPELKEPEDERIRKSLIDMLKNDEKCYLKEIAWLEKQSQKETDPRYENLEELLAADAIYQMAMNDDMVQEAKTKAINALSELEIGKLLGIERQGQIFTKKDVHDAFIKGLTFAKDELEKQNKQILANSAKKN